MYQLWKGTHQLWRTFAEVLGMDPSLWQQTGYHKITRALILPHIFGPGIQQICRVSKGDNGSEYVAALDSGAISKIFRFCPFYRAYLPVPLTQQAWQITSGPLCGSGCGRFHEAPVQVSGHRVWVDYSEVSSHISLLALATLMAPR